MSPGVAAPASRRPRWEAPAADDPERVALPLHLRAAAAALFDDLPAPAPEAADAAAGAVDRFRALLSEQVPAGTEVTVDAYRVRLAASCPASAVGGDDGFSWTPATAARHLGLRAVALHLCGDGRPPVEQAVRSVLAEHIDNGGERTPGPWLAGLDAAGRAVAEAQARRWAEQAVGWLPLRLVGAGSLRFLDDDWWPGGRGGRALVIHGRRDLTVEVGGSRVAVTMAGGTARTAGLADGHALTALAAILCDPRARLVRVVRVHPASGEVVATDVTPALLRRGVEVVAATASALCRTGAPETPGPACTWCDRRPSCGPGTAWLQRPDRRSMGLPLRPRRQAGATSGPAPPVSDLVAK